MDIIKENERLKAENEKLRKELQKFKGGGRPSKFTDEEKASIEMYRLQGKTIKEIAEMFNCSTRTVDRVLKERKEGELRWEIKRLED